MVVAEDALPVNVPLLLVPNARAALADAAREAVLEADGKQFVYVVESPDRYVKREVKVSNISPDQVRVLEGLARGQRIVTKGAVLIKNQDVKAS